MYIVYKNKTLDSNEHVPDYEQIVGIFKMDEYAIDIYGNKLYYTIIEIDSDF